MRHRIWIVLVVVATLFCLAVSGLAGEKSSWRIDGKLIRRGDHKSKVLSIAGKPNYRNVEKIEEKYGKDKVKTMIWTYESEDKNKVHRVFFRGDKVTKIEWERY